MWRRSGWHIQPRIRVDPGAAGQTVAAQHVIRVDRGACGNTVQRFVEPQLIQHPARRNRARRGYLRATRSRDGLVDRDRAKAADGGVGVRGRQRCSVVCRRSTGQCRRVRGGCSGQFAGGQTQRSRQQHSAQQSFHSHDVAPGLSLFSFSVDQGTHARLNGATTPHARLPAC